MNENMLNYFSAKIKIFTPFFYLCASVCQIKANTMITKDVFQYCLPLNVRDYELDGQGIVNNAVYQNYMEHTRHEFIKTIGLNFSDLCRQGVDVVVARIEIAFKHSLRGDDRFVSCVSVKKEGVKYVFDQAIFHADNEQLIARGKVTIVARINGKLSASSVIDRALKNVK